METTIVYWGYIEIIIKNLTVALNQQDHLSCIALRILW